MAWDPTLPGVRKALTLKLQSIIQSGIADLNTAFTNDSTLSFIINSPFSSLLTSCVTRGDQEAVWDPTAGLVRISVSSGGFESGSENTVTQEYIDNTQAGGRKNVYTTTIFALFHPDSFRVKDAVSDSSAKQAQIKEDAVSTVEDWLNFRVLNSQANRSLSLTSQCLHTVGGADFDLVGWCMATQFSKGIFVRASNQSLGCYGVSATHTCLIA